MSKVELLLPKILKWEGGFANDPADSGGATNKGVTLATFRAYRKAHKMKIPTVEDLKRITDAEVMAILKEFYWDKMQADSIANQSIANLCVNNLWGSGTGYIKTIQGVLKVKQDGIVGPVTLAKLNGWKPQSDIFNRLWHRRRKFFFDIVDSSVAAYERKIGRKATESELMRYTKKRFLKGWLNRLNDFQFEE
jgi:lysozyme family protein